MFPWLNRNAGAMQALMAGGSLLVAFILAIFNAWYIILTRRMVSESRNTYLNAAIPAVRMRMAPRRGGTSNAVFGIELSNEGLGPAVDMRALLPVDLHDLFVITIDDTVAARVLGPGQSTKLFAYQLGRVDDPIQGQRIENLSGRDFTVTISYTDVYGRAFSSLATLGSQANDRLSSTVFLKSFRYVAPTIPGAASSASPKSPDPPIAPVPAESEDH